MGFDESLLKKEQAKALYGFLAGNSAVNQLVSADRKETVIHIKLGVRDAVDIEKLLLQIEKVAQWDNFSDFSRSNTMKTESLRRYLTDRLYVIAQRKGLRLDEKTVEKELSLEKAEISMKVITPQVKDSFAFGRSAH